MIHGCLSKIFELQKTSFHLLVATHFEFAVTMYSEFIFPDKKTTSVDSPAFCLSVGNASTLVTFWLCCLYVGSVSTLVPFWPCRPERISSVTKIRKRLKRFPFLTSCVWLLLTRSILVKYRAMIGLVCGPGTLVRISRRRTSKVVKKEFVKPLTLASRGYVEGFSPCHCMTR